MSTSSQDADSERMLTTTVQTAAFTSSSISTGARALSELLVTHKGTQSVGDLGIVEELYYWSTPISLSEHPSPHLDTVPLIFDNFCPLFGQLVSSFSITVN